MNIKRTILSKDENTHQFFGFSLCIFLLVFCYIILRAYCTEPLHDEISTFYFYVYLGEFRGSELYTDANNHLLNSVLGFGINKLFGESVFLFRLPNVLSFPIYFWSIYAILKNLSIQWHKVLGLTALSTIPFIIEYFAYCRGYGIGMAFFMLSLFALLRYVKTRNNWTLVLVYLSLWIAVCANLIFINISLVILGLLVIHILVNRTKWIGFGLITLAFIALLFPFVYIVFKLKESGALYYGSSDGLWNVTGKSLSEMVFFSGGTFAFILVSVLMVLLFIGLIKMLSNQSKKNIESPQAVFTGLFFGNILLILSLAIVLHVNYPEDRTGMQLIPLFILGLIFLLDRYPNYKWASLALLFFPISFITHLSIHSSIYSPDQRMSYRFYEKVRAQMTDESTIASYHMNLWTWNWNESFRIDKRSILLTDYPDSPVYDFILAKRNTIKNPDIFSLYDTVAIDPRTHDLALKIKKPLTRKLLAEIPGENSWINGEYFDIFNCDSLAFIPNNSGFQLTVEFDLITSTEKQSLQLVFQTFDVKGQQLERCFYPIGLAYRNMFVDAHLKHHFVLPNVSKETKNIKVYIWNKDQTTYEVKNGKCYLYTVKN